MPPIRVDPDTYEAASKIFGTEIANSVFDTYCTLQDGLENSSGMAGSDPAGQSWGSSYDSALDQVNGVTQDVINANYVLAGLLSTSGFNHGLANDASKPGGVIETTDTSDYAGDSVSLGGFQTASGGNGDTPSGWWLVEHTVGYVWPNGDTGKLRSAASAWSKAAGSITDAGYWVPSAVEALSANQSPEIANATTACNAMATHLTDLSIAYNSMSNACTTYAGYIDKAHSDAISELESLIEWTAGIEVAGGIVSFFTAGIAEAPTQAVEAGRIAATAARIASIISHLIDLAGEVAETITNAASKIIEVSSKLKVLLGARLSKITADLVAKLGPTVVEDAEDIAIKDLDFSTDPDTAYFWSGRNNGVSVMKSARQIASDNGGTTLEQLMEKRGITLPEWDPDDPAVVKQWSDASAAYAEGASGTVRAVIGDDLRPGNVWQGSELPALEANPFVTKIIQIDPATGIETVVWPK